VTGSAFTSFKTYEHDLDLPVGGVPLAFPFTALVRSLNKIVMTQHRFYWIRNLLWDMLSVVLAIITYLKPNRTRLFRMWPTEMIACGAYLVFFLSYKEDVGSYWARFMIPILPLQLSAIRKQLPANRALLWACAPLCAFFACMDVLGYKYVLGEHPYQLMHRLLHP
jgi:hypothetical protein